MNREVKKKLTITLLRLFTFASYSIGYDVMCEVMKFVGYLQPKFSPKRADIVKKNFLMIRGNTDGWEEVFINFWGCTTDILYLPYMTAEEILGKLKRVDNIEVLKWFKNNGKPLIVTTAHVGMPEMLANFASLLGFPGVAVAEVPSDEWFREFLKLRSRFGMRIIPMGNSYPILVEAIKNGEFVYLVSDRDIKRKGIAIPFGRGKKFFPSGFANLSVETNTPLVFGCGVPLQPCGKYYGFITEPYYPKGVYDALEWYASTLYETVYKWTDKWFVFQDEWAS